MRLTKKEMHQNYFSKITESGVNTNFGKIITAFLTNKGFHSGNEITLIENNEIITEQKILTEKFSNLYTNIVERSCRVRPTKLNLVNSSHASYTIL